MITSNTNDDWEILQRFRQNGDADAFAELVQRYINLVWATGSRITGDPDLARDIAQNVFTDFARKARSLPENTILAGWLHRAASFAARRLLRDETRRRTRERLAMDLQSPPASPEPEETIARLLPVLDDAIAALNQSDREAVLLRFFSNKSLAEIGSALGVSEDAAQKRLSRAIDRLRLLFHKRGTEFSTACIATALSVAGAQAAPAGIAVAIATGSATAAAATGTTLFQQMFTHLTSASALMKTPSIATALVAAAVSVPLLYQESQRSHLLRENSSLESLIAGQANPDDAQGRSRTLRISGTELDQLRRGYAELQQLQAEAAALKAQDLPSKLDLQRRLAAAKPKLVSAQSDASQTEEKIDSQDLRLRRVTQLKHLALAARIFASNNKDAMPKTFDELGDLLKQFQNNPELPDGIELDVFEFFPHDRPVAESEPQLALFREKQPRRLPNGKWTRVYALVDGSVQQTESDTPDFSEWDRRFMAQPEKPVSNSALVQ